MRAVLLGSPPFCLPIFRALHASSHELRALVTPPDRPRGRGRRVERSPLAQLADDAGLPVVQPETTRDPSFVATLRGLEADVLVVASYGELLRSDVLELCAHGALNVHGSLLPRWRGASPVQRAILAGDAVTGVTVQRMVLALDAGDIVVARETPIGAEETYGELLERLSVLGGEAILTALDRLEAGSAEFTPQDPALVTRAPKLTREDGAVDWSRSAAEIARQVRGLSPWPSATTTLPGGRSLKLHRVLVRDGEAPGEAATPGQLIDARLGVVATGDGALQLVRIQPAGKPAMEADAFLRGAHLEPGQIFGQEAR